MSDEFDQNDQEKREADLQKRLEKLEKDTGASRNNESALASILQDPEVAAVLAAKKEGKAVHVVAKEEEREPDIDLDSIDFDVLDNKDMVKLLMKVTAQQSASIVRDSIKPVTDSISVLNQHLESQQNEKVNLEIQEAKRKFKDFDYYAPAMAELSKSNPGLTVTELYSIAKERIGEAAPPEVNTERPTQTTVASSRKGKEQEKAPVHRFGRRKQFLEMIENSATMKEASE
jgi:hypothetical protein